MSLHLLKRTLVGTTTYIPASLCPANSLLLLLPKHWWRAEKSQKNIPPMLCSDSFTLREYWEGGGSLH